MKSPIEHALERDTLLTRGVACWLDQCDYVLGRRDEAMAFAYIVERVLLALAGLWWLWNHAPYCLGYCFYSLPLVPIVWWARRKR
jgi:hypothetical protein